MIAPDLTAASVTGPFKLVAKEDASFQ